MANLLIFFGTMLVMLGLLLTIFPKLGFPHLPGDILIQRNNFMFYFPITTSFLLSIALTLLSNLFR